VHDAALRQLNPISIDDERNKLHECSVAVEMAIIPLDNTMRKNLVFTLDKRPMPPYNLASFGGTPSKVSRKRFVLAWKVKSML
jgi:hypothetical protein